MNDAPKPKKGWRILRWILICAAILATLIAVFYTEEDWRGKRDWQNYKAEWEAKGEKFDWQAFVPPPVPDDQNFFTAPIVTNILSGYFYFSTARSDGGYPNIKGSSWAEGRMTDLKGWQAYYRNSTNAHSTNEFPIAPQPQTPAADIVLALSKYDSAIAELQQAAQRPGSRLPLNYDNAFDTVSALLPYMGALKRSCQVLELHAAAELANGQSDKAFNDIKLMLRVNDSIRNQPLLISHLVRVALLQLTLQPIWEGLAEHRWTDEQLAGLERELSKQDLLADYESCLRGERAFAIDIFESQRLTREQIMDVGNGDLVTNRFSLMPEAYFYQNELNFARISQQYTLPLVDTNSRVISPEALKQAYEAIQAQMKHPSIYKTQSLMAFPAVASTVKKLAYAQNAIDLARIACALERHHLAHGEYPPSLNALTPQFIEAIPHDIINGRPLHYQRTDDGKFLLYSIGWNAVDDGGQIGLSKKGTWDKDKGDWAWPSTAK